MDGIGPELPLNRDHRFGNFSLVTSYKDQIKQNFKNLLLTAPGERMMIPDFGIGLRHFLFNPRPNAVSLIRQRIVSQTSKYLPYIVIRKISFDENKLEEDALDSHLLSIVIDYEVPNLNLQASIVLQSEDVN